MARPNRWIDKPTMIEAATILRRNIVVVVRDAKTAKWANGGTVGPREAKKKAVEEAAAHPPIVVAFKGNHYVAAAIRSGDNVEGTRHRVEVGGAAERSRRRE